MSTQTKPTQGLTAHPAADLFPMMKGDAYESFKADIAERGLLEPVWLYQGQILDGRNRYRACVDLGIEPEFREYTGDSPTAFAWSLNGKRRHLTPGQLSAVAVNMLPALEQEARKRQVAHLKQGQSRPVTAHVQEREAGETGESAAHASKIVGVSPRAIYMAKAVKRDDPETFEKLQAGEISVTKAAKVAKKRQSPTPTMTPAGKQSRAERAEQIKAMAEEGHRGEQIAAELGINVPYVRKLAREEGITLPEFRFGKTARIKTDRVIGETVNSLIGLNGGLQVVRDSIGSIDPQQASEWAEAISEPLKSLNWLSKKLKEIANGN